MAAKDVVVSGCDNSVKTNNIENGNRDELTKAAQNKTDATMEVPKRSKLPHVPSGTCSSKSTIGVSRHKGATRKSRPCHREPKVPASQSRLSLTYLCKTWQDLRGYESSSDLQLYVHALFCATVRFTLSHHWMQIKPNQRENLRYNLSLLKSKACQTLAGLLPEPWGEAYVAALKHFSTVNRNASDPNEEALVKQVPHYCTEACIFEPRDVKHARIELLCYAGCKSEALQLCLFYRRCPVLATDHFIAESTLHLLYHLGSVKHIIDEMESFSCHDGYQLIQLMLKKEESTTLHPLIECLTQILLVRDLVGPSTYCCTVSLMNLWCLLHVKQKSDLNAVTQEARKLGALATTSAHLYLLVDVLYKQYGRSLLPLYLNLYVHALTIDINNLEYARQVDCRVAVAELETHMAAMYTKLASLLVTEEDLGLAHECALTAFSLEPTLERLEHLQKWAEVRPAMWSYQHVIRPVPCEGECHCSEKGLCRRDPPVPSWFMTHVPNGILDSNLNGVSEQLLQDLCILVEGPRCRCLTWNMPWEILCNVCIHYLRTSHAHRAEVDDRCVGIEARLRRVGPFTSPYTPPLESMQNVPHILRKEIVSAVENPEETCNVVMDENQQCVVPPLVIKKNACDPEFVVVDRTWRPVGECEVMNPMPHSLRSETKNDFHCDISNCPKGSRGSYLYSVEPEVKNEISTPSSNSCTGFPEAVQVVKCSTTDAIGLENFANLDIRQDFEVNPDARSGAEVESLLNYKVIPVAPVLHTESLQLSMENNASDETLDPLTTAVVSTGERLSFDSEMLEATSTKDLPRIALYKCNTAKAKSESCLPIRVPTSLLLKSTKAPHIRVNLSGPPLTKRIKAEKLLMRTVPESIPTSAALSCPEHSYLCTSEHGTYDSVKEHLDRLNLLSIVATERSERIQCSEFVGRPSNQASDDKSNPEVNMLETSSTGPKFAGSSTVNCDRTVLPCSHTTSSVATTSVSANVLLLQTVPNLGSKPKAQFVSSEKAPAVKECLRKLLIPPVKEPPVEVLSHHHTLTNRSCVNQLQDCRQKTVGDNQNYLSILDHSKLLQQGNVRAEEQVAGEVLHVQQTTAISHEPLSNLEECGEFNQPVTTSLEKNQSISKKQINEECNVLNDKLMELLRSFDILPLNESSSLTLGSEFENSSGQTPDIVAPDGSAIEVKNGVDEVQSPGSSKLPLGSITLESLVAETLQLLPNDPSTHSTVSSTPLIENPGGSSFSTIPPVLVGMVASNAEVEMNDPPKIAVEASNVIPPHVSSDNLTKNIPVSQTFQSVSCATLHQNIASKSAANISLHSLPSVVYALPQQPHSSLLDHMYGESNLHHILAVQTPSTMSAITQQVSVPGVGISILGQHSAVFNESENLHSQSVVLALPQTSVASLPFTSTKENTITTNQILHTAPVASSASHSHLHQHTQMSDSGSLILQHSGDKQIHMGLTRIDVESSTGMDLSHIQLEPVTPVELPKQSSTISSHAKILNTTTAVASIHDTLPTFQTVVNRPSHLIAVPIHSTSQQSTPDILPPGSLHTSLTSTRVLSTFSPHSMQINLPAEAIQNVEIPGAVQSAIASRMPVIQPQMPLAHPVLSATMPSTSSNHSVRYYLHEGPATSVQATTSIELSKDVPAWNNSLETTRCIERTLSSKNHSESLQNMCSQMSGDANVQSGVSRTSEYHCAIIEGSSPHINTSSDLSLATNSAQRIVDCQSSLKPSMPSFSQQLGAPTKSLTHCASQIDKFGKCDAFNQVTSQMVKSSNTIDKASTVVVQLQQNQGNGNNSMTSLQSINHSSVGITGGEVCQKPFFRKDNASPEAVTQLTVKSSSISLPISSAVHLTQVENSNFSLPTEKNVCTIGQQEVQESSVVELKPKILHSEKLICSPTTGRRIIVPQRKDRKWISVRSAHGVMGYRKIDSDDSLLSSTTSIPSSIIVTTTHAVSSDNYTTGTVLSTSSVPSNTMTTVTPNVPLVKKCYSPAVFSHCTNTGTLLSRVVTSPTAVITTTTAVPTNTTTTSCSSPEQGSLQLAHSTEHTVLTVQPRSVKTPLSHSKITMQPKAFSMSLQNSAAKTVTIGSHVIALHPKSLVLPLNQPLHCPQNTTVLHTQSPQVLDATPPLLIHNHVGSTQPQVVAVNQQSIVAQSTPVVFSIQKSTQSLQVPIPATVGAVLQSKPLVVSSANTTQPLHSLTAASNSAILSQQKLVLEIPNSLQGTQSKFVIRSQPISSSSSTASTNKVIQSQKLKQILIPGAHSSLKAGSKTVTTLPANSIKVAVPGFAHVLSSKEGQPTSLNVAMENVVQNLESDPYVKSSLSRTSGPLTGVILQSSEKPTKFVSQNSMLPSVNLKSGLSTFVSIAKSYLVQNKEKTIMQPGPQIKAQLASAAVINQATPSSSNNANRARTPSAPQHIGNPLNNKRKLDSSSSILSKKVEKKQCPICPKLLSSPHCLRRHLSSVHHVSPSSSSSANQSELPKKLANANRHEKATEEQVDLLVKRILMESANLNSTVKSSPGAKVHSEGLVSDQGLQRIESAVEVKTKLSEQANETQSIGKHVKTDSNASECVVEVKLQSSPIASNDKIRSSESSAKTGTSLKEQAPRVKVLSSGPDSIKKLLATGQCTQPVVLLKERVSINDPHLRRQTVQTKQQSFVPSADEKIQSIQQCSSTELLTGGPVAEVKALPSIHSPVRQLQLCTKATGTGSDREIQTKLQTIEHVVEVRLSSNSPPTELQLQPDVQPVQATNSAMLMLHTESLLVPSSPVANQTVTTVIVSEQPEKSFQVISCGTDHLLLDKNSSENEPVQEDANRDQVDDDDEQTKKLAGAEIEADTTEVTELSSDEEEEEEDEEGPVQMPLLVPVVALTPIDFDVHYSKGLSPPKIEMVAMQPTVSVPHSKEMRGRASSRNVKPAQKRCCPCCENTSPNSSTKRQCKNERLKRSNVPVLRKGTSPKCTRKTRASGRSNRS